jgi:hypothetical protein
MRCFQLALNSAVSALNLCYPLTLHVPHFPHPAGAAVEPGPHSATYSAIVGYLSDLAAVELHPDPNSVEEELHAEQQFQHMAKEQVEVEGKEKEAELED